jgi:phosphopantothenoylcysteine decarboxylase/phosphopantothenate--cysteine ligase
VLRPEGPLRGLKVLVTAGPTYEDVDPVRYIGNRSSGRMGFAVAAEAVRRGAEVTLVAGPTTLEPPQWGVTEVVRVRSAREMHRAVLSRADQADVIVMAAAVADYEPVEASDHKVSKDRETLTLTLRRTPDILAELGQRRVARGRGPVLVGFAAETEDVVRRAAAKREQKHADIIVANDVSRADAGFEVEVNAVTIVGPEGAEALAVQPKSRVAAEILNRVERLLRSGGVRVES